MQVILEVYLQGCESVGWCETLVKTEISQQLLNELTLKFMLLKG